MRPTRNWKPTLRVESVADVEHAPGDRAGPLGHDARAGARRREDRGQAATELKGAPLRRPIPLTVIGTVTKAELAVEVPSDALMERKPKPARTPI